MDGWMAPGTDCVRECKQYLPSFLPSRSELVYLLPIKLDSTSLPFRNQLESNPSDEQRRRLFDVVFLRNRINRVNPLTPSDKKKEKKKRVCWFRPRCGSNQVSRTGRHYCVTRHPVLSTTISLFSVGSALFVCFNFAL